jgi:hypothetical protein
MPSTGIPDAITLLSTVGAPSSLTDRGPPERMRAEYSRMLTSPNLSTSTISE